MCAMKLIYSGDWKKKIDLPVTRQKRSDERSFAFENLVSPIQPSTFTLRIRSRSFDPLENLNFRVKTRTRSIVRKTALDGTFKVPKPTDKEMELSFASEGS